MDATASHLSISLPVQANLPRYSQRGVLITGGTSGIGLELTRTATQDGHRVTAIGRDSDKLQRIAKEIPDASLVALDLLQCRPPRQTILPATLDRMFPFPKFRKIIDSVEKRGPLDCAILNAGISGLNPREPLNVSAWQLSILAQFAQVVPALARANGILIFVSSPLVYEAANMRRDVGEVPKEIEPYIILKSAIESWMRRLCRMTSRELGWTRVVFIDPGSVDTSMHEEVLKFAGPALRDRTLERKQRGDLRSPEQVAKAIYQIGMTGKMKNLETGAYDLTIDSCSRVTLTAGMLEVK